MEIKITKTKAQWNKSEFGNSKDIIIVEFPNCDFKWMPTYEQLNQINKALKEVEKESWKK